MAKGETGSFQQTEPLAVAHDAVVADGFSTRLDALDALRGLMATAVAMYHLSVWTHAFEGSARTAVILGGIYSVQGFFIISGLCFFKLYARARFDAPVLRGFYVRRFLRIAPLFYVAIALTYLTGTPVNPKAGWDRALENLTLSFGLFHPNHAMVLGGWSIGIECLFYAAFPVLAWLTRKRIYLYALLMLGIACAWPYSFGKVQETAVPAQFNMYVHVPNHAFLFLIGGVIADLMERTRLRLPVWLSLASSALLCGWCVRQQAEIIDHVAVMVGDSRVEYVVLCSAVVLLWALSRPSAWMRVLGKFGALSYSVYLMHPFAWLITARVLPSTATPMLQLCTGLAVTFAIAALSYRMLERPAIRWGRRLSALHPNAGSRCLDAPIPS